MSKEFTESYYLTHPEILDNFKDVIRYHQKEKEKSKRKYANVLKNYELFLNQIATLLRTLGYHSTIDASFLLSYLIEQGYLSYENIFKSYSPLPEREIPSHLGTSILTGEGCCRHLAKMHEEIFKRLNMESKQLYCYQGSNLFGRADKSEANHVINLIPYDNNYYGIDIYNGNKLYRFKDALTMTEISSFTSYTLRYKPYYEVMTGESSVEEMLSYLKQYEELSSLPVLNPFEVGEIKYEAKKRLEQKQRELKEFKEDTKVLKKTIVNEMDALMQD